MNNESKNKKLHLPTLRGRMGDWIYYVTLLRFSDVAEIVSMVFEVHKSEKLSQWIQRQVSNRTGDITRYLETQEQRFFNSLILGIYGGKPSWQEIEIKESPDIYDEESINYLDRSFGVLTLSGDEKIFPIDGQHRTKAIKEAIKGGSREQLAQDEVSAIFVAHRDTVEGEERTRRLFTTLNRYAKPVSKSEIIALDEDDNCAILTRVMVDEFELFKDKILFSKSKSISADKKHVFTNIIVLYDAITTLLTNKRIASLSVEGEDYRKFTKRRSTESNLLQKKIFLENIFTELVENIPVLKSFFIDGEEINRADNNSSLLFRPIGQNVLFNVVKVSIDKGIKKEAIDFFANVDFSLNNSIWKKIFWNSEVGQINTNKTSQNYATLLILKHLGLSFELTNRYKEIFESYGITSDSIR